MRLWAMGVDPGRSGGIALVTHDDEPLTWKVPDTLADLWAIVGSLEPGRVTLAAIEKVHSSPQMGVTSAFTFGRSLGQLEAMLAASRIPFESVGPRVWQKRLGCLTGGDKNVSKRRAQELYPRAKVTHAVADALLLATWALWTASERRGMVVV